MVTDGGGTLVVPAAKAIGTFGIDPFDVLRVSSALGKLQTSPFAGAFINKTAPTRAIILRRPRPPSAAIVAKERKITIEAKKSIERETNFLKFLKDGLESGKFTEEEIKTIQEKRLELRKQKAAKARKSQSKSLTIDDALFEQKLQLVPVQARAAIRERRAEAKARKDAKNRKTKGLDKREPTDIKAAPAPIAEFDTLELTRFVKRVEIDEESGKDTQVTVILEDVGNILLDSSLVETGSFIRVFLGYVDDLKDFGEFIIKEIQPTLPREGEAEIRLVAQSKMIKFAQEDETAAFKNLRDSDIARATAARFGLQAKIQQSPIVHRELTQANQSLANFMQERADTLGYEFYVEDDTLHFHEPQDDRVEKVLQYRGENPNVGNLVEFAINENRHRRARKQVAKKIDAKTGRAVDLQEDLIDQGPAAEAITAENKLQKKARITAQEAFLDTIIAERPVQFVSLMDAEGLESEVRELLNTREREARYFVDIEGMAIGMPDLRRGKTVKIEGIGVKYSGLYYIKKATHTHDENGYMTAFMAKTTERSEGKSNIDDRAAKDTAEEDNNKKKNGRLERDRAQYELLVSKMSEDERKELKRLQVILRKDREKREARREQKQAELDASKR